MSLFNNMKRLLLTFVALLCCVAFSVIFYVNSIWSQPTGSFSENFLVPKGKGFNWVASQLEDKEVIPNANVFKLFQRFQYADIQVKAGEFDLSKSMTQAELIEKFGKGDVVLYQVTLIDGWNYQQFKQHLIQQDGLVSKLSSMTDEEVFDALKLKDKHPEGMFAPDTYFFQKGDSDLDILRRSHQNQLEILDIAWNNFESHTNYQELSQFISSPYKALILASIIEKETGQESERETISGVFYNRLKIGMKLQTDPTVIYGMGDRYKGNIRRKDLTTDTPYNTYTRYGLPPTPIAMPGKASILAALNPQETESFYFVGKGDGSHYFSKNLKEHNRAVAKYQLGK